MKEASIRSPEEILPLIHPVANNAIRNPDPDPEIPEPAKRHDKTLRTGSRSVLEFIVCGSIGHPLILPEIFAANQYRALRNWQITPIGVC